VCVCFGAFCEGVRGEKQNIGPFIVVA